VVRVISYVEVRDADVGDVRSREPGKFEDSRYEIGRNDELEVHSHIELLVTTAVLAITYMYDDVDTILLE